MSVPTAVPTTRRDDAAGPSPLLEHREGDFFFSSPFGSVLGRGVAVPGSAAAYSPRWSGTARSLFAAAAEREVAEPLVVGALGFSPQTPPRLLVPRQVRRGRPPRWLPDVPAALGTAQWQVRPVPPVDVYLATVAHAVSAIEAGSLEKVVLSRALELTGIEDVPVGVLLRRLADRNACGHVFAADVSAAGDRVPRTLVGASPELLVSRRGTAVVSNPLAGSAPRHPDPVTDRARASALQSSEKDRREHAVVVDDLASRLAPLCSRLTVPAEPVLVRTPAMWHLSTRVTGTLADPDTTSLDVAEALHPTPAVGGIPVDAAVAAIRGLEQHDRRYYTGLVGWCDERGDGEWAIVLRCAEVQGRRLRLHAGGGIVAGSDPAAELAETSAKFRTFLAAVGLDVPL